MLLRYLPDCLLWGNTVSVSTYTIPSNHVTCLKLNEATAIISYEEHRERDEQLQDGPDPGYRSPQRPYRRLVEGRADASSVRHRATVLSDSGMLRRPVCVTNIMMPEMVENLLEDIRGQ